MYLLLPCLIAKLSCQKSSHIISVAEFFTGSLQVYSIVSSVISLAWSFSTYEANQKKGALDFSSDPIGRIVVILSTLMQVNTTVNDLPIKFALTRLGKKLVFGGSHKVSSYQTLVRRYSRLK